MGGRADSTKSKRCYPPQRPEWPPGREAGPGCASGRLRHFGLVCEERFELLQTRFLLGEELLLLVELGALPVRQSTERPDFGLLPLYFVQEHHVDDVVAHGLGLAVA